MRTYFQFSQNHEGDNILMNRNAKRLNGLFLNEFPIVHKQNPIPWYGVTLYLTNIFPSYDLSSSKTFANR